MFASMHALLKICALLTSV